MSYTALAIDLDGTLLVGEDLSARNRDAVAAAHAAGLAIIIATARWRHMAQRIADQIGLRNPSSPAVVHRFICLTVSGIFLIIGYQQHSSLNCMLCATSNVVSRR